MLLEKIVQDPTCISQEELQKRIEKSFNGADRTRAALEYCAIFRKSKQAKWITNLVLGSQSPDIFCAVREWHPFSDEQGNPAVYYRWGKTGCELDGVGIKEIHLYENSRNHNKIRVGSVCGQKILSSNIFGVASGASGTSSESNGWGINIPSMIGWFEEMGEAGTIPENLLEIIKRLKDEVDISQREKDVLMNFYDTTREFKPSQLVGESELSTLRKTIGNFRAILPRDLSDILFTNENITRAQAEPLVTFVYQDHKEVIEKLRNNKTARRTIDSERSRLDFTYPPGIDEMGWLVLRYIQDYESVNLNRRHGLTHLVLPIRLSEAGLFVSDDDAKDLAGAYQRHRTYSKEQLVEKRDERFKRLRSKRWSELKSQRARNNYVNAFMTRLEREVDQSPIAEDIWRVINGVAKSKAANTKTGYKTKAEMLSDPMGQHFVDLNLREFMAAGFPQDGLFPFRDRQFYNTVVEGNFPDTFMGNNTKYVVPYAARQIAFEDAQNIKNPSRRSTLLATRRIAIEAFQDIVMETARRFRYRLRKN